MLKWKYSYDRTGFEKSDGTFYQFRNELEAHLGCGNCLIYTNSSKQALLKEGYCLDGDYICSQIDEQELSKNASKIDEMFSKIGK